MPQICMVSAWDVSLGAEPDAMSFKNGPHMSQELSFWVQGLALEVQNWSTPTKSPCSGGVSSAPYQQPEPGPLQVSLAVAGDMSPLSGSQESLPCSRWETTQNLGDTGPSEATSAKFSSITVVQVSLRLIQELPLLLGEVYGHILKGPPALP